MKTPREILFDRHQGVEAKLDAVRQQALGALDSATAPEPLREQRQHAGARSWWGIISSLSSNIWAAPDKSGRPAGVSLRWHLAGLGAAWLVVLVLNFDYAPNPAEAIAQAKIPPRRELLAAMREHRRELLELTDSPGAGAGEPATLPARRSEVQSRIAIG